MFLLNFEQNEELIPFKYWRHSSAHWNSNRQGMNGYRHCVTIAFTYLDVTLWAIEQKLFTF